jgi:hypothetical protein
MSVYEIRSCIGGIKDKQIQLTRNTIELKVSTARSISSDATNGDQLNTSMNDSWDEDKQTNNINSTKLKSPLKTGKPISKKNSKAKSFIES